MLIYSITKLPRKYCGRNLLIEKFRDSKTMINSQLCISPSIKCRWRNMLKSINLYRSLGNPNKDYIIQQSDVTRLILGFCEKSIYLYRLVCQNPDVIQTFPSSLYCHGISLYNNIYSFLVVNSKQKYGKKYGNRVVFSCFVHDLQLNRTTKRGKTNIIVDARCEVYVFVLSLTCSSINT